SQNTKIDNFKSEVNTSLSNQNTSINQTTSAQNSKIATLESRMNTFTSLSEGSTTGDAELQDIRVGANGTTYSTAGDAVRGQYSQLKEDLVNLNGELYTDIFDMKSIKGNYTKSPGWKLVGDGTRIADTTSEIIIYKVSVGDLLHLKLNKHTDCVYYFAKTDSSFTAEAIVGDVIYNSVDKYVTVPSGATFLMISQKLNDTENLVAYARLTTDYDGQRLTDYMRVSDSVLKYIKGVNRFNSNDKNNVDGYYIVNNMLVENENYFVTHLIKVEENTTYFKNEDGQGIYYDKYLNIIGQHSGTSFTTPGGCVYYRTSATISIKSKFYVATENAICKFTDKPILSDDAKTAVEEVVDVMLQEGSSIKTVVTSAKSKMLNTTPANNNACVTFIDDDGRVEGYTRLFPIIKSKNIPYGFAIVPTYVGTVENYLTLEQMQEMYAYTNSDGNRLVEFLSHTYNHHGSGINGLTEKEVIIDCASAMEWMNNAGFDCHGFVYPHNQTDKNSRIGIRRFFDYGFIGVGFNQDGYLDHSKINRIAFGNGMEDNPTIDGVSDTTSIEYFKACVDKSIEDGEWLVFMTHVGSQSTEYDTMLSVLIDYIAEKGIFVLSPNDGFNQMRNPVNVGDIDGKYLFVGNDNFASNMIGYQYRLRDELKGNGIATEPITSFIPNAVTITYYNSSANAGYPTSAGVLESFYCKTSPDFSWQKWTAYPTCKQKMRFWNNTNKAWFDWAEIN
ncbi:MAG: hypothetical protein SOZ55_06030, partial [Ruminococcus sp.]|nr:hypothetical protein [Ruminococcus sp.]